MTRLINTGFETGDILDFSNQSGATPNTSTKYTGGYSMYFSSGNWGSFGISPAGDVLYISYFYYITGLSANYIARVYDTASNSLCEIYLNGTGIIEARRNGTFLASSGSQVIFGDQWHHIEWYVYIADSGGRSSVKVNGATVIDYTGDTKPSTNTDIYTLTIFNPGGGNQIYIDDVIINDDGGSAPDNTWVGRVRLFPLRPNANGNYSQWDRSTGSNNYECVDEVPASGTDYVYTATDDEIDSYNLAALSGLPSGAVFRSVIVVAEALVDSGSKKLALGVRSGSTDSFGTDKSIGPSYAPKYERFTTDPATAVAWTESGINAAEVAIKSRA